MGNSYLGREFYRDLTPEKMNKFALILLCWFQSVSGNETKVTDCSRGGDQEWIFYDNHFVVKTARNHF